ncbi:Bordetella pertussis toxin A [Ophiocordyceps camponoti-floridani]|uniref:Bordetella pertussis toxin A n=1 Tax=Ophiocordyceps camponoti-floridani TaxID=2030778 RepID=A0A8H4QC31_9HYPO|nr:Bordetella pertussis toxin A [Ophiocordyceps camponoti-floridani]
MSQITNILLEEEIDPELAPVAKKRKTTSSRNPYLDVAVSPAVFRPQPQPQPIPHPSPGLSHLPEIDHLFPDESGNTMLSKKVPPVVPARASAEELLEGWDASESPYAGPTGDILKDWELPDELLDLPSSPQRKQAATNMRAGFEIRDLLPEDLEAPEGSWRPSPALRPELVAADSSTSLNTPGDPHEDREPDTPSPPQPERGPADSSTPVTTTEDSLEEWELPDDLPDLTASPELEQAAAEGPLENLEDLEGLSSPISADGLPTGARFDFNSRDVLFLGDDKSQQSADRRKGTSSTSSRERPMAGHEAGLVRPGKSLSSVGGKTADFQPQHAGRTKSIEKLLSSLPPVPQNDPARQTQRAPKRKQGPKPESSKQCCQFNKRKRDCVPCPVPKQSSKKIQPTGKKFSTQKLDEMALAKAQEHLQDLAKRLKLSTMQISKALGRLRQDFQIRVPKPFKTLASKGMLALTFGLPFYVTDILQTFQRDSTDLEKAAAVTVIVPIVGCSTRLASEKEKGLSAADTTAITSMALCYAADALLFTPAFPFAVMLHFLSSITGSMQLLDKGFVQGRRDQAWEGHYQEIIKQMTSGPWHDKMTDWYLDEMLNISVTVSEARGILDVVSIVKEQELNQTATRAQQAKVEASLHNETIERSFCASLRNTRRQVMKQLPGADWLKTQAHQLNGKFIDLYRTQAELYHRMTPEKNQFMAPGSPMIWVPRGFQDALDRQFRALIDPILDHLSKTVTDRVKLEEFASKIRSHALQIMALPPSCGCPVDIDEIEAAGQKPSPSMSGQDLKKTLLCAASRGYNDILEKLRGWHVDLEATDEQGNTALMLAVQKGYEDTAAYLVAWQDAKNMVSSSQTVAAALWVPGSLIGSWDKWAPKGSTENNGRILGIRNQAGETAADIAKRNGLERVVELIRKATNG